MLLFGSLNPLLLSPAALRRLVVQAGFVPLLARLFARSKFDIQREVCVLADAPYLLDVARVRARADPGAWC